MKRKAFDYWLHYHLVLEEVHHGVELLVGPEEAPGEDGGQDLGEVVELRLETVGEL